MTILLTLLGAGLVAILVWLGVVSCKSIKFMKKMKKQNLILQNTIEENRLSAESSNTVIYETLYKEISESSNTRYKEIEELSKRIENEIHQIQNSITTTQNNIENVERKTDSRFDKFHDMIKNQMK